LFNFQNLIALLNDEECSSNIMLFAYSTTKVILHNKAKSQYQNIENKAVQNLLKILYQE